MLEHILRRMGFGASQADIAYWSGASLTSVINALLNYESAPSDVDSKIGQPDYAGITTSGGRPFSPDTSISDARQRWLFRMLHTQRPLEEKMALFWHNHFATAYQKLAGLASPERATRLMDNNPASLAGSPQGQVGLFRRHATGNFRDLLLDVARDPAMVLWLDSQLNTRTKPQENFGREIMELFTMGIGNYTEQDVYAAARVFTGFNVQVVGDRANRETSYYTFQFRSADHDTNAKEFTFPIYSDGSRTIPARAASAGEQDAIDLVNALARHPATAERLANRLYRFFVNETSTPDGAFISQLAQAYLTSNYSIKALLQRLFQSSQFLDSGTFFQRYSWPVEFAVRAVKETGWNGFSVNSALIPLTNMGQQLFEPPDVNGWALGAEWFSTSGMLTRMNFSATLAANQRFNLARDAQPYQQSPEQLLAYMLGRFQSMGFSGEAQAAMAEYLRAGGAWTGSESQLQQKAPGLARLIVGSGEYQFN